MRKKLRKDGKSTAEVDSQLQEIVRERYRLTKSDTEKCVKDKADYEWTASTPSLPRCWPIALGKLC